MFFTSWHVKLTALSRYLALYHNENFRSAGFTAAYEVTYIHYLNVKCINQSIFVTICQRKRPCETVRYRDTSLFSRCERHIMKG